MTRNLAIALVLAATGLAHANGRPSATSTINFRQGHEQDIAAGMTFGVLHSHDGGATWRWMCEAAVKYGGRYDPDYAYSTSGALFATTFDGSLVMRDGCTFNASAFGAARFSTITHGPDEALYMAATEVAFGSNPGDAKIYRSTDDGATFPVAATAGQLDDWYSSIEVAPTDPTRVYLAGYRIVAGQRAWQLYRSDDRGVTYQSLPATGYANSENAAFDIVGIERGAPNTLYMRVNQDREEPYTDSLWRSTNAGASFTKVLEKTDLLSVVLRANGDLVAATPTLGAVVSHDRGDHWVPLVGAPHINCLVENAAGEVWACTQNYGSKPGVVPVIPSDGAGIMKTTDLATWTPVLKFQDIRGPVECAVGTRQHDQCVDDCNGMVYDTDPATCPNTAPTYWCAFKKQIGITSTEIDCAVPVTPDTTTPPVTPPPDDPGCCDAGAGAPTALLGGLLVGILVSRRRRARYPGRP